MYGHIWNRLRWELPHLVDVPGLLSKRVYAVYSAILLELVIMNKIASKQDYTNLFSLYAGLGYLNLQPKKKSRLQHFLNLARK